MKVTKIISTLFSIIVGFATIYAFYISISDEKPVIDIKTVTCEHLTDLPKIQDLTSQYRFKDSLVSDLWKLNLIIKNVGDHVIIGKGPQKTIMDSVLHFYVKSGFKILEFQCKPNEVFNLYSNKNSINFSFLQWRPNEEISLSIFLEKETHNNDSPNLFLNDREIIDGEVTYSKIGNEKEYLIDIFPNYIRIFIVILIVFLSVLSIGGFTFLYVREIFLRIKFKIWQSKYLIIYTDFVNNLIKEKKLKSYHEPRKLPNHLWKEFSHSMPDFPETIINAFYLTLWFFLILIISLAPLLFITPKFW